MVAFLCSAACLAADGQQHVAPLPFWSGDASKGLPTGDFTLEQEG